MRGQERGDAVALVVAPDHPGVPDREVQLDRTVGRRLLRSVPSGGGAGGPEQRGILGQDPGLKLPQLRTGLDTDLVEQQLAGSAEGRKGLLGAPAAVGGEHAVGPQPLAQRDGGDRRLEIGQGALGVAHGEQRLDPPLAHLGVQLLEPGDRGAGPRLVPRRG